MGEILQLDYYYGIEAEQFSFYRVPRLLIKDERFKKLSSDAKLLYGLMLDRMSLSMKNEWFDDENRAYIIYTIDTKRIMEREIKKGSTPLSFEQMEIDTNNYQEITSVEKLTQVLQYLHRVGNYKSLAGKTVINNVYTFMRGRTPDFTRARSIFDREKIYHQMLRQERKMKPTYEGDCYIETAKCYFSLPEEWEKHKMIYLNNDAYGFILSNKYILGLYKYCREARRDIAMEAHEIPENTNTVVQRLINMENLEVLSHCLLLDDVWIEDNLIGAKMYTIFKLGISSQSTAFLL